MRRFLVITLLSVAWVLGGHTLVVHALSNDPKQFIKSDDTFYAYVKGGEKISASFLRANLDGTGGVRKNVTVTMDGPGIKQKTCTISNNVAVAKGCEFAPQTASTTGIWRIQFIAPADAKPYPEVHPVVRWGRNIFQWNVTVSDSKGEKHGRVWTDRYAIYQPSPAAYRGDFTYYYMSEDGYVYKSTEFGYNGVASVLSADAIGIRKNGECVSAYRSVEIVDTQYSPSFGTCGDIYKLFFEEPAGDLPTKATRWDGTEDWIHPSVSHPTLSELHFTADSSQDQQSGTISFFLHNFIGQYQIKIDTDNDGSFDGQGDVTMNEQMKSLSNGLQQIGFSGVDRQGQIIPRSQPIGIEINITKVAEIHLVAADVEGRSGGLELVRLSGDNAPTTRMCWNDTELAPITAAALMTTTVDGRDCPDSTTGIHGWNYGGGSWGDKRYIDDWIYASAKLDGSNKIVYSNSSEKTASAKHYNWLLVSLAAGTIVLLAIVAIVVAVILRRRRQPSVPIVPPPQPPGIQPMQSQDPSGQPPNSDDPDRY